VNEEIKSLYRFMLIRSYTPHDLTQVQTFIRKYIGGGKFWCSHKYKCISFMCRWNDIVVDPTNNEHSYICLKCGQRKFTDRPLSHKDHEVHGG